MTFNRRFDITLTYMARWVDANITNPDRDNDIFVEYLYHLVCNKAEKHNYFNDLDTYDDFALFCISKFLTRFSNTQENPVKSVINYLNTVIEYWRAEYIRDYCVGSPDLNLADFNVSDFSDYLIDAASDNDYNSYAYCCLRVADVIRKHLSKIPIRKCSPEWTNIYISCLLTLENRLKTAANICNMYDITDTALIDKCVRNLKTLPPILFHIPEEQSSYINVLVNEAIHALSCELTHTIHSKVSVSCCLRNLVAAANNEEDDD